MDSFHADIRGVLIGQRECTTTLFTSRFQVGQHRWNYVGYYFRVIDPLNNGKDPQEIDEAVRRKRQITLLFVLKTFLSSV